MKHTYIALTFASLTLLSGCEDPQRINIAKALTAKSLCSATMIGGLEPLIAKNQLIAPIVKPLPLFWTIDINPKTNVFTVGDRIFLNESSKFAASYSPTNGCTSLAGKTLADIEPYRVTGANLPPLDPTTPWPDGSQGVVEKVEGIDYAQLKRAIDEAFTGRTSTKRNTLAVLVAHKGQLIAEQYALSATANAPLVGWSMTKSITGTLIGMLSDRNLIDIDAPVPFPQWRDQPQAAITTRNLLHMNSGLDYVEHTEERTDGFTMVLLRNNTVDYMLQKQRLESPATYNYSTGDTVLLGHLLQTLLGGTPQASYDFIQHELFKPLGIRNAIIEYDASGNLAAGSGAHLKGRDWLRLGQLYLQKGQWNGLQLVSQQWIEYATTPSALNPNYGVQLFLNTNKALWKDVPETAYKFSGFQFQRTVVVPEHDLVIVRLGATKRDDESKENPDLDPAGINDLVSGVIKALPKN